jgi:hypothetical protein
MYSSDDDSTASDSSFSDQEQEEAFDYVDDESSTVVSDITDMESQDEIDTEPIFDFIYRCEETFLESNKTSGHYYLSSVNEQDGEYLLWTPLSKKAFYQFPYASIAKYLYNYGGRMTNKLEIIQLYIQPDGTHTCIIKTFWLRLFQKHWRKVFVEREAVLRKRMNMACLLHFEQNGRYLNDANAIPPFRGMLSCYNGNKKNQ